jgi:hypothetical protein
MKTLQTTLHITIMLQSTKSPTLVIVLIDKNQKVLRTEVEL